MTLSPQQSAVRDGGVNGLSMVVEAGPGSGKTHTLNATARAMLDAGTVRKGLYVGFNKITATEAKGKFPAQWDCRTGHSLAFAKFGAPRRHKLPSARKAQSLTVVATLLDIPALHTDPVNGGEGVWVQPERIAHTAAVTIQRFTRSADFDVTARHIPRRLTPEGADPDQFREAVLDAANAMWADLTNTRGQLRMEHDVYRKLWQLSVPRLYTDVVMLDEAQDTAPVLADVIQRQQCQQIVVGDSAQQLYGWAGAVDALARWDSRVPRFQLSHSFRFGEAVAEETNKWLRVMGSTMRLTGHPDIPSRLVGADRPTRAVLCRTNAGAVAEVVTAIEAGRKVAMTGGGGEIEAVADAAEALMAGRPTNHPEFAIYSSWKEVEAAARRDEDGPLRTLVGLVNRFTPEGLKAAMRALVPSEDRAEVVVSTGHKAKGREWHSVRACADFAPKGDAADLAANGVPQETAMLAYVTVSRATHELDPGPLAYVDDVLPEVAASA